MVPDGPRSIGDYEILAEIARGGMGVVYKARQKGLDRVVALKVILQGQLASPEAVARFEAEARAAAALHHPGIVAVHGVGEHEGHRWFSMDFVEGRSLADAGQLEPARAARIVKDAAEAVQYAHERGVWHRDLKPANLLLDADGRVRITDFGLAKRETGPGLTQTGMVLGTPGYLPPEQASSAFGAVGPWSDVYGLGAVLYELLTGQPPVQGDTPVETVLKTLDREPVAPRRLRRDVPAALDTICTKCLAREPARRYASARALADDLGRFLKGEPIAARPASAPRRALLWARRHPAAAGLLATVVLALAALVLVSLLYTARLEDRLRDSLLERARANRSAGDGARALEAVAEAAALGPGPELRTEAIHALALPLFRPVAEIPLEGQHRAWDTVRAAFSADGAVLFLCDRGLTAFDTATGSRIAALGGTTVDAGHLAVHPEGSLVAVSSLDTGEKGEIVTLPVRLWNPKSGEVREIPDTSDPLRFSPDGALLALRSGNDTLVWDLARHTEHARLDGSSALGWVGARELAIHDDARSVRVWNVDTREWTVQRPLRLFLKTSADGRTVLFGDVNLVKEARHHELEVWDLVRGEAVASFRVPAETWSGAYLAPDGSLVALRDPDLPDRIRIWDVGAERTVQFLGGLDDAPERAMWWGSFSPDGAFFSCETRGAVRVWDLATGREVFRFPDAHSAVWSPDGRWLALTEGFGRVHLISCRSLVPRRHAGRRVAAISLAPDRVAANGTVWTLPGLERQHSGKAHETVTFAPDGAAWRLSWPHGRNSIPPEEAPLTLGRLGADRAHVLERPPDSREVRLLTGEVVSVPALVAFSADGRHLALARRTTVIGESGWSGGNDRVEVWSLSGDAPAPLRPPRERRGPPKPPVLFAPYGDGTVHALAFSPHGRWLAVGDDAGVLVLDTSPGGERHRLRRATTWTSRDDLAEGWNNKTTHGDGTFTYELFQPVRCVAFAPDGRVLAGGDDGTVKAYDPGTFEEVLSLGPHGSAVTSLAAGRRIATGDAKGTVRLWDGDRTVALWRAHDAPVTALAWDSAGTLLVSGDAGGDVRFWNLPALRRELRALGLDW